MSALPHWRQPKQPPWTQHPCCSAPPAPPRSCASSLLAAPACRYSVGRISHAPLPRTASRDEYSLKVAVWGRGEPFMRNGVITSQVCRASRNSRNMPLVPARCTARGDGAGRGVHAIVGSNCRPFQDIQCSARRAPGANLSLGAVCMRGRLLLRTSSPPPPLPPRSPLQVHQDFPRGGSEMTPVHPAEDFQWTDFAPLTFRRCAAGGGGRGAAVSLRTGAVVSCPQLTGCLSGYVGLVQHTPGSRPALIRPLLAPRAVAPAPGPLPPARHVYPAPARPRPPPFQAARAVRSGRLLLHAVAVLRPLAPPPGQSGKERQRVLPKPGGRAGGRRGTGATGGSQQLLGPTLLLACPSTRRRNCRPSPPPITG